MTTLTHHSNEAWDVFLTRPSRHQTIARKCNSVPVNSPGWRYDNEHKKANVRLGILPVYPLTGKIKWKTNIYTVRIIQIYMPAWVFPNKWSCNQKIECRGKEGSRGKFPRAITDTHRPLLQTPSPGPGLTDPLLFFMWGLWPAVAALLNSFWEMQIFRPHFRPTDLEPTF